MKKYLILAICFFVMVPVFAQTAAELENLLNTNAVSYQQAAWLVLEAADISASARIINQAGAFRYATEQGWFPAGVNPTGTIRLDEVSLLVMQSFDIRGGVFYTLTGNRRYAYRELVYRNIIQGRSCPTMAVSGDMLLFVVNRVLSFQEANQL
jgi:hypothetical protein